MTGKADSVQDQQPRGVAAGVVDQSPRPGAEHQRLEAFIGKWMTAGQTVAAPQAPSVPILASDVYEWMPGGFFVLHAAYGRIGDIDVGGTEIIGYDPTSKAYQSTFYDSQGNISRSQLTRQDNAWRWQGEKTRATSVVSDDGKTHTVRHERSDDGVSWAPSMNVTLSKVE